MYQDAPDLNIADRKQQHEGQQKKAGKPRRSDAGENFTRFLINVGKKDGVHPARLIGQINENTAVARIKIGRIEVMNYSSLLEAESRFASHVLKAFTGLMINGKHVSVEVTSGAPRTKKRKEYGKDERKAGPVLKNAGQQKKEKGKKSAKKRQRDAQFFL